MGTAYLTLEAEIVKSLGDRTDLQTGDSRLVLWYNWVYRHLAQAFDFHELEAMNEAVSVATGENSVLISSIGSDVWIIRGVRDMTNEKPLNPMREWADLLVLDRTEEDDPSFYLHYGLSILFDKTLYSDITYAFYYKKQPDVSSSTFDLSEEWELPLVFAWQWFGWRQLLEFERAELCKRDFVQIVRTMIPKYDEERFSRDFGLTPVLQ